MIEAQRFKERWEGGSRKEVKREKQRRRTAQPEKGSLL